MSYGISTRMQNVYPSLKATAYIRFSVLLILILVGCSFMVQTYPWLWILVAICGVLSAPLFLEFLWLPAILIIVPFDIVFSLLRKKQELFTTKAVDLKRSFMFKIQGVYSRLPFGNFNVYELGLAFLAVNFANSMGAQSQKATYNMLVSGPMLPLYEQANALLEGNQLADNSDKVLVQALMARELYRAGKAPESLRSLAKAADLYESLTEKERIDVAEISVLLADVFLAMKDADKKKGMDIALQTLSTIENSAVNVQPLEQLKSLVSALNLVAQFHQACGENVVAKPFAERSEALTNALQTKGIFL